MNEVVQINDDAEEGKENGVYHLRKGKSTRNNKVEREKTSSPDVEESNSNEKKQDESEKQPTSPGSGPPILTVPQRSSPASTNASKKLPAFPQDPSSCEIYIFA